MNKFKSYKSFFSWFFILVFGVFYLIIPLFAFGANYSDAGQKLAFLTFIAIIFYYIGLNFGMTKKISSSYFYFSFYKFSKIIFGLYLLTLIVIFATAGTIPLLASIKGASVYDLMIYREMFLKTREGWESLLAYAVTVLDSALLPYLIIEAFLRKYKYRYIYVLIFLLYSISFLEKAYIFKIIIPLATLFYFRTKNKVKFLTISGLCMFLVVVFMFTVSKSEDSFQEQGYYAVRFFSLDYTPQNISQAILWRTFAIPIVTALDALEVFKNQFFNQYFFGSTSSILAFFTRQERINFERFVYQAQFGGSETGNANQTYILEAFTNFGYLGVAVFSLFIGRLIRMTLKTQNIAFIAIVPLFLYNLFSSGLIGNLLSNGFILFFLLVKYVKLKNENEQLF